LGLDKDAQLISLGLFELNNNEIQIDKSLSQFYYCETYNGTSSILIELNREISTEKEKDRLSNLINRIGTKPNADHHIHFDIAVINKTFIVNFPNVKLKNKLLDTNSL